MPQFRTATGQTGRDAYVFTAAKIANAQRELDDEFKALVKVMQNEAPEVFEASTDFAFSGAEAAAHLRDYLIYGAVEAAKKHPSR